MVGEGEGSACKDSSIIYKICGNAMGRLFQPKVTAIFCTIYSLISEEHNCKIIITGVPFTCLFFLYVYFLM